MFLTFKEKGKNEIVQYQLPPDLSFSDTKNYAKRIIRLKLDTIVPLIFSRAVASLQTESGLIASRIYLSSDHILVWEDTDPSKLSGEQKKEMCRILGFRTVNEYERKKMRDRGEFDYYDKMEF